MKAQDRSNYITSAIVILCSGILLGALTFALTGSSWQPTATAPKAIIRSRLLPMTQACIRCIFELAWTNVACSVGHAPPLALPGQ